MSIQGISRAAFQQTRDFFKHSLKTDNKRYTENASADAGKIQRARTRLRAGRPLIGYAQTEARYDRTPRQYGRWLHLRGPLVAAGNCSEMSCVALYYLSVGQAQYAFPFPVRYVALEYPGNHVFLVAGYLPPVVVNVPYWETSTVSVEMMCNAIPDMAESYVVDVWAGIFCPTRVYPFELQVKLDKWSRQGKEVRWREHLWVDPGAENYVNSLLNSRFFIRDPADPF